MTRTPLTALLDAHRTVILDGAMGTELDRRGVAMSLPLWSAGALISSPETVRQIHSDYIAAGADIITANTFRTTARTFRIAGLADRSAELTCLAVSLAREARASFPSRQTLIAGSVAPLEDCYRPERVPPLEVLRSEHARIADGLAEAGVDFLLLETMGTVREAWAASEAARRTGLEFVVSFLCDARGCLYGGEPLGEALGKVLSFSPSAVAINCISPRTLAPALGRLQDALRTSPDTRLVAAGVYANVGVPGSEHGSLLTTDVTEEEYAEFARGWVQSGVRIIGGCCGTTPEYILSLHRALGRI
ncbi:MAG TPA: homocysteine S-methyltransferase family protein [Bacteroidota bacterium]|nr:homocysteine S-methyltransferase family protein [Bacteroidota bacterium]